MRVGWQSWSLEVSDEWSVTDHPECLSLTLSDEAALQVSSARKQDGVVAEQDLLFQEEERELWGKWKPVQCGEFDGIVYEYSQEAIVWRRWFLRNGPILLFVTYNGTPEAAKREGAAVSTVLNTARAEAGGEA
jgi:hypothetical protein